MSRVTVKINNVGEVLKALDALDRARVQVGVPSTKTSREDGPISNAALAYIHENGAPEVNIPARPFLRKGVEAARERVIARMMAGASAALSVKGILARRALVDRTLHAVGLIGQNAVRAEINEGDFAPLAEKTLAARRRAGAKGTKPLIRTGQLRNAITYVIKGGN